MTPIMRTALGLAVIAASAVVIFFPGARPSAGPLALVLYFAMAGDMLMQSWRAGHLHKTLGEISKNPPVVGAVWVLANAMGLIAALLVM